MLFSCSNERSYEFKKKNLDVITIYLEKESLNKSAFNLNGNVKAIIEYEPILNSKNINTEKFQIENYIYNQLEINNLFKIDRETYYKSIDSYLFNQSGKVVQSNIFAIFERNRVEDVYEYKYDTDNKLTAITTADFYNRIKKRKTYIYNNKNELVELRTFDKYSNDSSKTNLFYNHDKMIILDSAFTKNHFNKVDTFEYKSGEVLEKEASMDRREDKTYDNFGNLISYKILAFRDFEAMDTLVYHYTKFDYNENNQKIRKINYNDEFQIFDIETFLYDRNGELIQNTYFSKNKSNTKLYKDNKIPIGSFSNGYDKDYGLTFNTSFYDKFGNNTSSKYINLSKKKDLYEENHQTLIEYDSIGNWIEKSYMKNDSLKDKRIREIIYY